MVLRLNKAYFLLMQCEFLQNRHDKIFKTKRQTIWKELYPSDPEEIDLYLRTIYSLLRSSEEVRIRTLEGVHAGTDSSLHMYAKENQPDTSALLYSLQRLPKEIIHVKKVILGQSSSSFIERGYQDIESWQEVSARARRRKCYYNGDDIPACFASRSDIDDVVPVLTALQIEWNKLHFLINTLPEGLLEKALPSKRKSFYQLGQLLHLSIDDLARLFTILGEDFTSTMRLFGSRQADFSIQLLSGSLNDYRRATVDWWRNIEDNFPEITECPIYFVSSNTHSLTNLLSGYALGKKDILLSHIRENEPALEAEWEEINRQDSTL